jgi:hypothetical protein
MKKLFSLFLLSVLLTGCTSVTNITPTDCTRAPSGFYRVEAQWASRRQVVRPDSFKVWVVVNGYDTYPMQRVPLVKDRWEAYIPVPANKDVLLYHYKFDFLENTMGPARPNSKLSHEYELRIK